MKALAQLLADRLRCRGLDYADVRVVHRMTEQITVRNGAPESVDAGESCGFGVRVLAGGCWGFAASSDLRTARLDEIIERAILVARAAGHVAGSKDTFVPPPPAVASYATPVLVDPWSVPLADKLNLLSVCTSAMMRERTVRHAEGTMDTVRERKVFASTTGSLIEQEIVECGAGIAAYAVGRGDMQVRSYPSSFRGNFATAGFEFIDSLNLEENAPRVAAEAAELLRAPVCPAGETDIILSGNQLALQIHESVGHAVELDRILGWEASFAGTSFIQPGMIGSLKYGSPQMNITSDPTVPLGLGTFAFDDEGYPARPDPIVREGTLVGVLSSGSTAPLVGLAPNATMRADGWEHFPLIRMTNLNLEPGGWTLDDLVADTEEGVLLDTNRSWSIDDKRINFQFAVECAREIRGGKAGRLFKNALYSGVSTRFWAGCDAVCDSAHWQMWGVPNCGKGEPMQDAHVGHGCAPARFRRVTVGGG